MMRFGQVTIVGSGIAGLCAAAAIAPSADKVLVLCRDRRPPIPETRKSVPQGDHISILLQAGLLKLEGLLPGIHEELVHAGAASIRAGSGQQIFINGCWTHERPLDLVFLGQSRPFLEYHIHRRIARLQNVTIMPQARVDKLMFSDTGRVCGVSGTNMSGGFSHSADLVIDATGNGGRLFRQVESFLGCEFPTDIMEIGIFYATAFFTKPPEYRDQTENILILPEVGQSRIGGSLIDVEQDVWCVSLHGRRGALPPRDMKEWMAMAMSLPDSRIWERLRNATLLRPMKTFKKPRAHWRHFENSQDVLPPGYLPIGDVISSLNPIFGQGMTVSIGHADSLSAACNEGEAGFLHTYLQGAASWSRSAWVMTRQYEQRLSKAGSMTEREQQLLTQLSERYHESIRGSEDTHLQIVRQSQMLGID